MNITKYFGAILAIVGSTGVFVDPRILPLAFIGILIFIQGSEDQVIKQTVKCIQENKSFDDLKNEEYQSLDEDVHSYSKK